MPTASDAITQATPTVTAKTQITRIFEPAQASGITQVVRNYSEVARNLGGQLKILKDFPGARTLADTFPISSMRVTNDLGQFLTALNVEFDPEGVLDIWIARSKNADLHRVSLRPLNCRSTVPVGVDRRYGRILAGCMDQAIWYVAFTRSEEPGGRVLDAVLFRNKSKVIPPAGDRQEQKVPQPIKLMITIWQQTYGQVRRP